MPFPVAKLVYLGLKQIAKPISKAIQNRAKTDPFLRTYILMRPAQWYHNMETKLKMRLLGLGKTKEVKPLNDEMAVDLGAEMLGELIIFSVGAGILYLEYKRQQRNEDRKEYKQNDKLTELDMKVRDLGILVEQQNTQIRELTRIVHSQITELLPQKIVNEKTKTVLQVEKSR